MVILNILINPYFDLCQLFGSHALKMREVETQTLGIYQRAFLRYMVAKNVSERLVQQVCCTVIFADSAALNVINFGNRFVAFINGTFYLTAVSKSITHFLCIGNKELTISHFEYTSITYLTTRFSVKWRLIQHDNPFLTIGQCFAEAVATD